LFVDRTPFALLEVTKFRRRAYAKLWLAWGASYAEQLPGNTEAELRKANGVVLEIGAGSGELLHLYDEKKIQTIYGVEPAEDLYERLEKQADSAGFGDGRYIILKCGAEPEELVPALAKSGFLNNNNLGGNFDTIVCVRVLCMVSDFDETVSLYVKWTYRLHDTPTVKFLHRLEYYIVVFQRKVYKRERQRREVLLFLENIMDRTLTLCFYL
jgi:hypothetical protein